MSAKPGVLSSIVQRVKADYLSTKNKKFMMVDALIVYCIFTALIQVD
jgi:hypothetical protein